MEIKKIKEKFSTYDIATGAKKATSTIALIVALSVPMAALTSTTAYASVPADYIVGDLQYTEDRTSIKEAEYQDIINHFNGYDEEGYAFVTSDKIRKAIELSNLLNEYYFDPLYYTNTTKDEVVELDIDGIYERYEGTLNIEEFCSSNLENKPAIDAYVTFSCGTVANNIKSALSSRIYDVLASKGKTINEYPVVYITEAEIYALAKVDNVLEKITLSGEATQELISIYNALNNRYQTALNNIGGYSELFENSFAYNGVNSNDPRENQESVWLSLPDDEKKADLTIGMDLLANLENAEIYSISSENSFKVSDLPRSEEKELKDLGYSTKEVNKAVKREIILTKILPKTLVK